MTRQDRIRALAWSLPDVTPAPAGQRLGDGRRAPAPSHWAACPDRCDQGVVRDRFGRSQPCVRCQGRGRVRVDAYTGDHVSTLDAPAPVRTRRVMCDRCAGAGVWMHDRCQLCNGSGSRSVPDVRPPAPRVRTGLQLAAGEIARLREAGSYDELEQAVGWMRALEPQAVRPWTLVRVEGVLEERHAGGWLRVGDMLVDGLMPARVLVPAQVRFAWEHTRDGRTLRERAAALSRRGVGVVAIARSQGVSVRAVRKALGR